MFALLEGKVGEMGSMRYQEGEEKVLRPLSIMQLK